MAFEIVWAEPAVEALRKMEKLVARQIIKKVDELKESPYKNVRKLMNSPYFRIRVGDYRVIFDVDPRLSRISIVKVGHRKSMYK
jgi:mRNA interferase RelE/StbE